jgi:hypothetical protein
METLELPHVLWIGGPSGSGKTTIGKRLAINHGLRYFGIDKLMQVHHSRGLERGLPAMTRWDELTPDERWLADPQEMAALLMAISDEVWSLLLEDLRTLPPFPGIVVEGRPLRPLFVAPLSDQKRNAVWVFPTAEAQERNLNARGGSAPSLASDPDRAWRNRIQRELLVARQLEAEAAELDCLTVRVDSGDDLDTAYAAVEATLQPALQTVPCAATADERFALRRAENDDLAAHLHLFLAERPDAGTPDTLSTRFACECGAARDREEVELTLTEYAQTVAADDRVVAAGHAPEGSA